MMVNIIIVAINDVTQSLTMLFLLAEVSLNSISDKISKQIAELIVEFFIWQWHEGACMFGPIYFPLNKNLKNVHFGSLQQSIEQV